MTSRISKFQGIMKYIEQGLFQAFLTTSKWIINNYHFMRRNIDAKRNKGQTLTSLKIGLTYACIVQRNPDILYICLTLYKCD